MLCNAMNYLKNHPNTTSSKNPQIRLDRNHRSIHPSVSINNQEDYDYHIALLNYLYQQSQQGFDAKWLITIHYQHPSEHAKPFKETNNLYGFRDRINFKTKRSIWNETSLYNYWDKMRNDSYQVEKDANAIKCRILKHLYQVKRLNRPDKYKIPNYYFFNERGKSKLKYHTHIVLPETICYNSHKELEEVFNTTIRERSKSISLWKDIHVVEINSINDIFGYLNKETTADFFAFDPINSNPIINSNIK